MKLKKYLDEKKDNHSYGWNIKTTKISKNPIYRDKEINIYYLDDLKNAGVDGFLREDNAGRSSVCLNDSREDELMFAAWNANLDIRKLSEYLAEETLELALKDAKENEWGFEDSKNIWDMEE